MTEDFEDAAAQMEETFGAVASFRAQTAVIFPNNDAGSEKVRHVVEHHRIAFLRVERSLLRRYYVGLMRAASVLVGNSSSGLIEAPCFGLPAVSVGDRQRDRVHGNNVIDVSYDRQAICEAISRALSSEFRNWLQRTSENPYFGDGRVADRIVSTLKSIDIDEKLLKKQISY